MRKPERGKNFCYFNKFGMIFVRLCGAILIFVFPAFAQKIAVLTPDKTIGSRIFAAELEKSLAPQLTVLDADLSETAFRSAAFENAFNLSTAEAKNIGAAIGCSYFLLVKYENLRRSAYKREEYYEAHSVVYVVSSRTGNLVFWDLKKFEDDKPSAAEKKLLDSINITARQISENLRPAKEKEIADAARPNIEELPESSPPSENFRPPMPYRRIKPEYTAEANFYDVEATVDIEVDVSGSGKILRTEITRWAGYGLDESVTENVKKMNWRPAERNGKPLPMRILLRYNFKNIEDDEN